MKRRSRNRRRSQINGHFLDQLDADLPRRLAVFARGAPEEWTKIVVHAHAALINQGLRDAAGRACDYAPWQKALTAVGARHIDLMSFAETAGRPPWPVERENLIEFALTFLDADPMLFRSGYAKRHLLDRLRQCSLPTEQFDRLSRILKHAVTRGTGVEEFRAYCRIAGALRPPGLAEWLRPFANQAKLDRARHLGSADRLRLSPEFAEKGWPEYTRTLGYKPPRHAVSADLCGELIPMTARDWSDPQNRCAVNAWLMLRAIDRRSQVGHEAP